MNLYAVIMAGGRGERFWPLGRRDTPKQLLKLTCDNSMLEETVLRLLPLLKPENILVVTNRQYVRQIQQLLPIPEENVIGEPIGRDTAPCVALAAGMILRRSGGPATMIMLPADQAIRPAKLLQRTLQTAADAAQSGALVTIGIRPTEAATGYGYIQLGPHLGGDLYQVDGFREKPGRELAEQFLAAGNFRWNSGIFVWTVEAILRAFGECCPALRLLTERLASAPDPAAVIEREFPRSPKISIDYAVMENAENIQMVDGRFDWDDVGSWKALRKQFKSDPAGNVCRGPVVTLGSEDCILISEPDHLLGVVGVRDLVVVKAGNATLVCPVEQVQQVKVLVQQIAERQLDEYL